MNYTFIGDIHSASDDLKVLLNAINTEEDRLIFLGDYIGQQLGIFQSMKKRN
ncbi:metallophosphoesterase [Pediococcus parvulus]|uniref:metallophosphoesterase n=1 Tax=Pediococcus parvulus TaxID=54062 RepID=UPI00345E1E55